MNANTINHDALNEYAHTLHDAGFNIYQPNRRYPHEKDTYFTYSRFVDGVECFGTVQVDQTPLLSGSFQHSMPIKPSREHGSGMFVDGVDDGPDVLTIEAATRVASPTNRNPLVGTHKNWKDERFLASSFTRWDAPKRTPELGKIRRINGVAGQFGYRVTVTYPGESPVTTTFAAPEHGTPGPVVMLSGPVSTIVSEPERFGETLNPSWVRAFYA